LRIEKSIDDQVEVKAEYARSCFGMSLEELITITQAVSSTRLPQSISASDLNETDINNQSTKLTVPKELWRLVDALFSSGGLDEKGLFNTPTDRSEVVAVREALDNNWEFGPSSPHAIANCLISFLCSFPKPLLPPSQYPTVRFPYSLV
jgi:inositol polyphosphate 5-phosphatase INPP5B/F